MKKAFGILLLIMILCFSFTAQALELNVQSQSLSTLYDLRAQVESQQQLLALTNRTSYKTVSNYDDFERNPFNHTNELITFKGTIAQVVEGSKGAVIYRIAMNGNSSRMFFVEYKRPDTASRLLEEDEVTVYARFNELMTYTSTTGKPITVPYCIADLVIRPVSRTNIRSASASELTKALEEIDARLAKLNAPNSAGYIKLSTSNYDDYARRDAAHKGEKITFSGTVLQVVRGQSSNTLRIAVDNDSNRIIYCRHTPKSSDVSMMEDDRVTIRGTCNGLYTYSSTYGGDITIPYCTVESVTNSSYTKPSTFPKDSQGNYKITTATYEDYFRRADAHKNEKVTLSGTVVQVIEGKSSSEYRVALDNKSDKVVYVILPSSKATVRVLEDDKVTITGTYRGVISYESTHGVQITIPCVDATSANVQGYTTSSASKNASGEYTVTSTNYEAFARNQNAYKNNPLTFTAKVVQVMEGSDFNTYRMAVGSNNNCMFYVQIDRDDMSIRILENDTVTVHGTYYGLYTYRSTYGGNITIPSAIITSYTVKGYTAGATVSKSSDGYYWVTASNFDQFDRNAKAYEGKKIRFVGEVIQVVERSSGNNVYRIAVDSDYDCIFYVEYKLPRGTSRILDGDVVQLTGEYYGLFTYSTTMGSSVTVPATIASEITKSYTELRQGSSGTDVTKMKKRLQELGYYNKGESLNAQYNEFCVGVVKEFQRINGLPQTGVADSRTLTVLYSTSAKPKR